MEGSQPFIYRCATRGTRTVTCPLSSSKRNSGESPTREQMRAEFEKIDKQVTAVLTKTQQKKYEEMKQTRQNRRQK